MLYEKLLPVSKATTDQYFRYVSLLLHGDGTNGAQNNTFLDSSTNNFTITRNGNTTQGSFSPYGNLWSNYFDGSGDYLTAPSNAAFSFGTGDFTVESWFNISGPSALDGSSQRNAGICSCYPTSGAISNSYALIISGNSTVTGTGIAFINYQSSVQYTVSATTSISYGSWNHVAVSRFGTTTKLFLNGVEIASGTLGNQTVNCGYAMQVGGIAYTGYLDQFNGYISNLRITKGTALYASNFTPSTTPLTAISGTTLLTCQSNRFIDNSSNNLTLTVAGNTSVQRFSPFSPVAPYSASTIGGSGYFDGNGDYLALPSDASLNMGTDNWTVECFVYITSRALTYPLIFGNNTATYTSGSIALTASNGSTTDTFYLSSSTGMGALAASVKNVFNTWYHLAVVRNGTSLVMYRNGESVASKTIAAGTTADWGLLGSKVGGGNWDGAQSYFNGYISNLRVVKGTAVYTGNFTPPTSPVTAISGTSLLTNFTNAGIYDNAMMTDLETVGNAQVSTSVKKYGTGSMAFDGTGDYLSVPNSPNLQLGTGNFTIEFWLYSGNLTGTKQIFNTQSGSTNVNISYAIITNGTACQYYLSSTGTTWDIASGVSIGTVALNTWYHVALVRNGSTITPYLNGVAGTATTSSATLFAFTSPLQIGRAGTVTTTDFNGYIDDMRVTKGIARYTANFTPPTQAFPNQ